MEVSSLLFVAFDTLNLVQFNLETVFTGVITLVLCMVLPPFLITLWIMSATFALDLLREYRRLRAASAEVSLFLYLAMELAC